MVAGFKGLLKTNITNISNSVTIVLFVLKSGGMVAGFGKFLKANITNTSNTIMITLLSLNSL